MINKDFAFGEKILRLTAYAENVIRVRISDKFEPTLFERYGIWRAPDENAGKLASTKNGVLSGFLYAEYSEGVLTFSSDAFERKINLACGDAGEVRKYFEDNLCGMRPSRAQVIGDYSEWERKTVDFTKDPKYFSMKTEGELFYGLGESNEDRLVLNGKPYLERIVYQKCEVTVPFIMTKAGYGILCNTTFWHGIDVCSKSENEVIWYLPDGEIDFFIFAGRTLADINERLTYITGRPILLPKWAYGLTFVEQYNADQFEVMRNAAQFRELNLPCDMFSLEPGWMAKKYDFSIDKKWNTDRFYICDWMRGGKKPRPYEFTQALLRYGFKLQLWLCCQHDFTAYEEKLAGNDTDFGIPEWFEHLEKFCFDGAAAFKVDPCHVVDITDETRTYANGKSEPEMHNLMQTLCAKDMYQGAARYRGTRPMHHFCGGYTGSGAYTAMTTGDSGGKLKTLAWILNCGLTGISAMTCDMDIYSKHTIHYCFFTAWCQLNSWAGFAQPWWAGDEMQAYFTFYDNLRYRLMPYIYSTSIYGNMTGMPTCRAMPYVTDDDEVKNSVYEYMFGEDFLVGAFSDEIWLPRGNDWIDYWTGKRYSGGQMIKIDLPEGKGGALYVKAGAIVPTEKPKQFTDCKDADEIILEIYPCGKSERDFYEDDGVSFGYKSGERAVTKITCEENGSSVRINIGKRIGNFDGMKDIRVYHIKVMSAKAPKKVTVDGKKADFSYENGYVLFDMKTCGSAEITY